MFGRKPELYNLERRTIVALEDIARSLRAISKSQDLPDLCRSCGKEIDPRFYKDGLCVICNPENTEG